MRELLNFLFLASVIEVCVQRVVQNENFIFCSTFLFYFFFMVLEQSLFCLDEVCGFVASNLRDVARMANHAVEGAAMT